MNDTQRKKWADKLFDIGAYIVGAALLKFVFYRGPFEKNLIFAAITMSLFAFYCFYVGHLLLSKEKE